ncbi:MAG: hypothetical protein OEU52_15765 [Xanthomonadales bacterium]|nr:hypothetical protein [Xanthomonadales bacterium]
MTKKKLTNKSKTFIGEVKDVIRTTQADKKEIDEEIAKGNKELLAFLQRVEPWAWLYSLSHEMILVLFLETIGERERMVELAEVEDKEEARMEFFSNLTNRAKNEELYDEFGELEPDEQGVIMAVFLALMGNMEGLKRYSLTVSEMVSRATDDHEFLFKAVAVDRSVVSNPIVAKEIGMASICQDEAFMNLLAKSITRTKPIHRAKLDETRFMLEIIDEVQGLDMLSNEHIAEYLQNELGVYPSDGKDPESALKKLLQRRKLIKGT